MVLRKANPETGDACFRVDMKPITCGSGIKYVEYYIDEMFDEHYNRTELYKIPVSRN
jgi:hypothetical protein